MAEGYRGSAADITRMARSNAKMRGSTSGDVTAEDWEAVLALYEHTCAYCRSPLLLDAPPQHPRKATLDHVIPLTDGGTHTRENIRPSCLLCNKRKGNRRIAPLPPPGMPMSASNPPLPPAGPRMTRKFTRINSVHVALIIERRHAGDSIHDLMRITGLTFNQIGYKLAELQREGKVPVFGRGRRKNVIP